MDGFATFLGKILILYLANILSKFYDLESKVTKKVKQVAGHKPPAGDVICHHTQVHLPHISQAQVAGHEPPAGVGISHHTPKHRPDITGSDKQQDMRISHDTQKLAVTSSRAQDSCR